MNSTQVLSELQFLDKYSRYDYELGRREKWEETVKRVVDFLVSYVPVSERDGVYNLLFDSILSKKVSPSMRLMATAGKAAKLNEASIFNCFGRETAFVSEFGTVSFFDFNDGDTVRVKTHDGTWKNAVVKNFGKQKLNKITFVRNRSTKTIRATPNHTWILSNGERTQSLKPKDIIFGLPDEITDWNFDNASPIEKIAWCYGYVFGDGSVSNKHSMVRLCGEQNKFLDRFLSCGFGNTTSMSLVGDNIVFTGKYLKTTPELSVENLEEIRAFVIGYLDADAAKTNCHGRKKFVSIQSSQDDHIDFIESAFEMVGVYLLNTRDLTGQETNFGIRPNTKHFGLTNRITKTNSLWSVKEIVEDVVDDVWCLVVDDNHSFVLSGGIVTGNCSYLPLETTQDFHDLTLLLGLGVGVGFSVENHFVKSLGDVRYQNKDRTIKFVVPDDIYGWAQSIKFLIEHKMAGNRVNFDYSLIRPAGSPLKTRGGRASGPEPLMDAHIAIGKVLDARQGKEIRSVDAFDIACHVAGAIVSGGVRRCLPSGSRVHTEHGMKKIEDVVLGDRVITTDGYCSVTNKFNQGMQALVRVVTQDSSFMCTPNHKIAVLTDQENYIWKRADELVFGDKLIAPYYLIEGKHQELPNFTLERPTNSTNIVVPELDEDMAWLLGLIHGDGHVDFTNGEVSISVNGEELELGVRAAAQLRRFGVNVGLSEYENYFVLRVKSRQLANYFHSWLKQANVEIRIPEFIWNAPYEIKMAYVSGVMDADGSVKTRPVNVVTTVYESFACDIQLLLSSCGIQSRVKALSTKNLKENWQPKFGVYLINNKGKFEFLETPTLFKREIDISTVEKRTNVFPDGVVWSDTDSPLIPVTFIKIENVEGEYQTWDLEVEDMHEFFCNGYLMHNSAMITIFDRDDDLMLGAKSGTWYENNLQRQYANISAVIDGELSKDEMYSLIQRMHDSGFGEPGIFSRYAVRQTMPERRKAVFGMGTNPSV